MRRTTSSSSSPVDAIQGDEDAPTGPGSYRGRILGHVQQALNCC
ncbi:hypothetical protein [Kitasatospora phosalacinea]|nr:hypothetical protein [Kitasatospora phosalacinea]